MIADVVASYSVYIYIYMYYIYTHIHTHIHMYIHIYICIIYIYMYTPICMYIIHLYTAVLSYTYSGVDIAFSWLHDAKGLKYQDRKYIGCPMLGFATLVWDRYSLHLGTGTLRARISRPGSLDSLRDLRDARA